MTCLIIDDNPLARLALRNMASEIEGLELAGECESAMEAFNFLQKDPADLLLLDVEMPGMSGLELLKNLEHQPLAILITSKADYAVEGFDLQVVDYIVKPVALPRLLKAIQRAQERYEAQQLATLQELGPSYLFARVNNSLLRIDFDDILFVQALGDYVVFQTADKKHPVHLTMKALEERLPSNRFLRVHRSYIVALDKISNLEQNSLQVGKHIVPVAETAKGELIRKLNVL
ncbi:MAG: response regulator transcription factor [Phaeodactylibacter sp.]|nr:response regulator transcription factor [Phaeodactylibacter sp.]MCB9300302.1 response regulator transcription factor [Lewinellaceae bacterium]